MDYARPILDRLTARLNEAPKRLQILAGPRQVGKTTLVRQFLAARPPLSGMYVAADLPERSTPTSDFSRAGTSSAVMAREPDLAQYCPFS